MKLKSRLTFIFLAVSILSIVIFILSISGYMSEQLLDLMTTALAILVAITFLMVIWVYTSILNPLYKLQDAARKIKEGSLDFSLDIEENDEIGQLFQDFEEMRIRLKENRDEKLQADLDSKELLRNISHDLKTPITAIKGYVEGIMDGVADSPEKLDKYIRTIYNKANDMDKLIDELSFYTKIDTNKIPYNFNKVSILDFFTDCASEVGLDLEARNIDFEFISEIKKDSIIIADVEQMKRVLNNIIGNAIKYLDKSPGKISIRLIDEGDFVRVAIADNGRGIKASDLPFIFDRFFRGDISRGSGQGGSGIGLSIVKKIIEDHGGRIWALSKEGIGTEIIMVLRKCQEVRAYE